MDDQSKALALIAKLSPAQREVLIALADGLTNKDVSNKLGKSFRTVEAHRREVERRLGVDSLVLAVRIAQQAGVLGSLSEFI